MKTKRYIDLIVLSIIAIILLVFVLMGAILGYEDVFPTIFGRATGEYFNQIFVKSSDNTNGNFGYNWVTLYMVAITTVIAYLFGLPLGVLLAITRKDGILPHPTFNKVLSWIVDILRSIPFLLLLIFLIPFTRNLLGRSYGTNALIVPLAIASIPFVARVVETSLLEVDRGLIEAFLTMKASKLTIIYHVYFRESIPSLVRGVAISSIAIIGYSTMSYVIGAGGLGQYAYSIGYVQKNDYALIARCIVALIIMVEFFQSSCNVLSKKIDKRN